MKPSRTRAAIYIRVSSDMQVDGYSLETQEQECREYCAANDYEVVGVYREVYTGVVLESRPELWRLRQAIEAGLFEAVVVWHSDRLSREPDDRIYLRVEASKHGARFESVSDSIGNTDEDRLVDYVRGFAAKQEWRRIRERSNIGSRARAKSGKLRGGHRQRYGYSFADETRSRYVENPDTAWVVRLIFERIADGMPKRTLARWLDEQGIATPGGSKRWRCLAIDQMVRSPMYRGEATVYLTKSVKTKDGKTRRVNRETSQGDDGFIELPDGVVPALVSDETWKAANHALDHGDKYRSTRYAAGKDPQDVLVRGHVVCECGYKMHIKRLADGPYIACQARARKAGNCPGNMIKASTLDNAVWSRVSWILTDASVLTREIERRRNTGDMVIDETTLDGPLAEVDRRIANTTDAITRVSGPSADPLFSRLETLTTERQALVNRQEELRIQRQAIEGQNRAIEDWIDALNDAEANVHTLDFAGKRAQLEALGVVVTVNYKHGDKPRYEVGIELPIAANDFAGSAEPWNATPPTVYRVTDQPDNSRPYQPVHNTPRGSFRGIAGGNPRRSRTDPPERFRS